MINGRANVYKHVFHSNQPLYTKNTAKRQRDTNTTKFHQTLVFLSWDMHFKMHFVWYASSVCCLILQNIYFSKYLVHIYTIEHPNPMGFKFSLYVKMNSSLLQKHVCLWGINVIFVGFYFYVLLIIDINTYINYSSKLLQVFSSKLVRCIRYLPNRLPMQLHIII